MKPIVAIVGRPNVGKSTFFNRITKSRDALVEDYPGVTRDRIYGDASWNEVEFTLIDTGGFTEEADDFAPLIRLQVRQAIEDADAIVFLMDGKGGISPFDKDIINSNTSHLICYCQGSAIEAASSPDTWQTCRHPPWHV